MKTLEIPVDRNQTYSSRTDQSAIHPDITELAQKISEIHGPVKIVAESSGIHIYFPSPYIVEEEGKTEVFRAWPHGALNAEKYLGLGKFRDKTQESERIARSAMCMKTRKPINMDALLAYDPIEDRIGQAVSRKVQEGSADREIHLVDDGKGNRIPRGPGCVTPITELDPDHPAVEFLYSRGFSNLQKLYDHMRVAYCYQEYEIDRATGVWHRPLANGFQDTPQGRVVFYADMFGVQEGWQARIMAKPNPDNPNVTDFFHPYRNTWDPMEIMGPEGKSILNVEAVGDGVWNKTYSKYKTANGAPRNKILMGLDAALRWNMMNGRDMNKIILLCEGPLDAARLGPPAVATLGGALSENQAKIVISNFSEVVYVADRDEVGEKAKEKFMSLFAGTGIKYSLYQLPEHVKDAGGLSQNEADAMMLEITEPTQRGLQLQR